MTKNLKSQLGQALNHYREIAHKAPAAQVAAASETVKELQKQVSDAIVEGSHPCPDCGAAPIGIEQPRAGGGVEYEVGCPNCRWFKHTDGTARAHGVRGGLLPRHAVEAWNAGPDYWRTKGRETFTDEAWNALPSRGK